MFHLRHVIGEHWDEFKARAREARSRGPADVLDDLGVERHCCRRMIVSHKDLVDIVSPYQ